MVGAAATPYLNYRQQACDDKNGSKSARFFTIRHEVKRGATSPLQVKRLQQAPNDTLNGGTVWVSVAPSQQCLRKEGSLGPLPTVLDSVRSP